MHAHGGNDRPEAAVDARLRRAEPRDAEGVAQAQIQTWQIAYRGQIPDSHLDQLSGEFDSRVERWRSHVSESAADKTEIWVSDSGSQVVGFVALGPARDADALTGEIYAIYVLPGHWNQGRGRALLRHATTRLSSLGYGAGILWVLESNQRARRFYEIAGWALDGGTKTETRPDGVELREVRYRVSLHQEEEA